jgi:hypothetical protein
MPYKFGTALLYAFLLWIIGFVWGIVVFIVPALKDAPSFPHISKYPAVSVPLILLYTVMVFFLTRIHLKATERKSLEGLRFGVTILLVNIALDSLVYVVLFKGSDYFSYLSIWFAYALFLIIPWLTGTWLERKNIR